MGTAKRDAIANPAKPNPNKAPKAEHLAGQVLFKTHKAEVKGKSADIPWPELAWLLDGRLQRDIGEIKIVIDSYKIDKAAKASLVAVGPEDTGMAHTRTMKDRLDHEEDRAALDRATDLHEKINQAIRWYGVAVACNDPLLASVKPV